MNQVAQPLLLIMIGIAGGALSGLIGVGGGIIIVPALVYVLGMAQKKAQGTSLAVLSVPVCLVGFWAYYKAGHADLKAAIWIILGFVGGTLLGSNIAVGMSSEVMLRRIFGAIIILVGIKMVLSK